MPQAFRDGIQPDLVELECALLCLVPYRDLGLGVLDPGADLGTRGALLAKVSCNMLL